VASPITDTRKLAFTFDPSPLYAVEVVYDENRIGHLDHRAAYDPQHECRCDKLATAHGARDCTPEALSAN